MKNEQTGSLCQREKFETNCAHSVFEKCYKMQKHVYVSLKINSTHKV